jgi:hypothetical protein
VGAALGCRRAPPPESCLAIDAPTAPVGFEAALSIRARAACDGLAGGTIAWRQLAGPPLLDVAITEGGLAFGARTPALGEVRPGPIPHGVIPLSPRTRGEIALEAVWSDGRGRNVRRELRFALAPRSRGLPNTPLATPVYLGGDGWRLTARPPTSSATLAPGRGAARLVPDVAGDYQVVDGHGEPLTLRSARYDETLLDCGRAGCHASITDAAAGSPMTTVLARGLTPAPGGGTAFGPGYPGCAIPCHATGEPGLADGGYADVAAELGLPADLAARWQDLPRPLRRLGGVGCLACHGPAALPPASARWSLLRTDVCAVCHDAPPRYGHVVAWGSTAMARADRDPRAGHDRGCAGCHTTWGYLAALGTGAVDRRPADRHPPDEAGPLGITCAACHAVHDAGHGGGLVPPASALLRAPAPPALLAEVAPRDRSAVCLRCHTPEPESATPSASAAALWLGRGGLDPQSGRPLPGPALHAGVAGGCVGCHRAPRVPVERGAGHAFAATSASCLPCHRQQLPVSDLPARARRLWDAWRGAAADRATGAATPVHAGGVRLDRTTPLGRAAWDVLLVLEDPAAGAHNPRYAGALLSIAEPAISAAAARARGAK